MDSWEMQFAFILYVHFLPTSARNEPKKRRSRGRGASKHGEVFEIFKPIVDAALFAIPSPLRIPLHSFSARGERGSGGVCFYDVVGWNLRGLVGCGGVKGGG